MTAGEVILLFFVVLLIFNTVLLGLIFIELRKLVADREVFLRLSCEETERLKIFAKIIRNE
ncbi:MAG: hypothetical protein ORO03_09905 [Alphaproteobacteria bacterium]|nr:hypothetical protein [Alphaproteobacteria bacterium]